MSKSSPERMHAHKPVRYLRKTFTALSNPVAINQIQIQTKASSQRRTNGADVQLFKAGNSKGLARRVGVLDLTFCYRIPQPGVKTSFGNSLTGCPNLCAHPPAKPIAERCTRFLKRPVRELAG
ncbi:hypothetical protein OKW11_002297 [Pseudomonas baetica]|nr:hypothetical protein [Pseudomonas baetica]